jgi:hypothetical protein
MHPGVRRADRLYYLANTISKIDYIFKYAHALSVGVIVSNPHDGLTGIQIFQTVGSLTPGQLLGCSGQPLWLQERRDKEDRKKYRDLLSRVPGPGAGVTAQQQAKPIVKCRRSRCCRRELKYAQGPMR